MAVTSCPRSTSRRARRTNGATSPVVPTVASAIRIGQMAAMLRGAIRGP